MKQVIIYTDGACQGNPGPGGWAAVGKDLDGSPFEISGYESATTNNRMELIATIQGLAHFKDSCRIVIYTDSQYVFNGIQRWVNGWKNNGWQTADKKPVKNIDLWKMLDTLNAHHQVEWNWVRGHAGHAENERVDALARQAVMKGLIQQHAEE